MIRDIIQEGDSILRRQMPDVHDAKKIAQVLGDLKDTMRDSHAAGFAANQIGEEVNICLVWEAKNYASKERKIYSLVNPKIVFRSGSQQSHEGCFSIPGYIAIIPRAMKVMVACQDKLYTFTGSESRIAQHEIDHLQGILMRDYVEGTNGKSGGTLISTNYENRPAIYQKARKHATKEA